MQRSLLKSTGAHHIGVWSSSMPKPTASTLAPFSYAHLLGAAVVGFIVFGDFPDLWTWVGASIIVGSGLYVFHRERVRKLPAGH